MYPTINRATLHAIELYGGPADGHIEVFATTPKSFILVPTTARSTPRWFSLFRLLTFQKQVESRLWAVYELRGEKEQMQYRYLRSNIHHGDVQFQHVDTLR